MQDLLCEINDAVNKTEDGCFDDITASTYRLRYRKVIETDEHQMLQLFSDGTKARD